MGRNSLPPGFRFHPTEVELVIYYLKRKVLGKKLPSVIADVDIYKYAPWALHDKSCHKSGDLIWYFFCPREKKCASGVRINRATDFGHWKITGNDRPVRYKNEIVATIKTLVFHTGKASKDRTDWFMHEYKLKEKVSSNDGVTQDSYVLCVIFKKDERGPKNGAQYGAPFNEEEWDEDTDNEQGTNVVENILYGAVAGPTPACPSIFNGSTITSSCAPGTPSVGPSASCQPENHVSVDHSRTIVNDNVCAATDTPEATVTNAIPAAPLASQIPHDRDYSVAPSASQVAMEEDTLAASPVAAEVVNKEETSPGLGEDIVKLLAVFDEGLSDPNESCVPETSCVEPSASCPSENHVSVHHSPAIVNDNVCAATDTPEAAVTNAIPVAPLAPQVPHELDYSVAPSASQVAMEDILAASSVAAEIVNKEETSPGRQVLGVKDVAKLLADSCHPNGSQDVTLMDDSCDRGLNNEAASDTNGGDIFDGLEDLGNLNGHNNCYGHEFLELRDLEERPVPYFNEVKIGGQIQSPGFYDNNSQPFDQTNVFNAVELIADLNQASPVLPNGSHGFEDQPEASRMDGGPRKRARRDRLID